MANKKIVLLISLRNAVKIKFIVPIKFRLESLILVYQILIE